MREKEIDGRHAEADSLGLGNQPGTIPFVTASAFTVSYLQVTSVKPVNRPESLAAFIGLPSCANRRRTVAHMEGRFPAAARLLQLRVLSFGLL
jgi:hypothetical protein